MRGRASDPSKLSQEPKQIRNRLRRKHAKFKDDLELYIDKAYGRPIEEWDLEELSRGRPRASDGTFKGRTPAWITPAIQQEAKRRLMDHTFGSMGKHVDLAITTIVNLLRSKAVDDHGRPIVDARTKLAAATFIIENVVGKPRALVEVDVQKDVIKEFFADALVLDDGSAAHPVIDGQFYEDEEEEDDDDEE